MILNLTLSLLDESHMNKLLKRWCTGKHSCGLCCWAPVWYGEFHSSDGSLGNSQHRLSSSHGDRHGNRSDWLFNLKRGISASIWKQATVKWRNVARQGSSRVWVLKGRHRERLTHSFTFFIQHLKTKLKKLELIFMFWLYKCIHAYMFVYNYII